ncbi:MAG: hypothetical protein Q9215_005050 [Flavoplaca cf. flavocitrina]
MHLSAILATTAFMATFALARPNLHHHHNHGGPRRHSAVSHIPEVGGTQTSSISTTTDVKVTYAPSSAASDDSAAIASANTESFSTHLYPSGLLSGSATPSIPTLATSLPTTAAAQLEGREPQWTTYVFTQLLSENITAVVGPMTKF